jgi:dipeptidyl aminopeptidase/acylaminoacyl peptidase
MKCKRSNNGELVGCLSPPPGLERAVFAGSNLYWFRLTNLGDVNNAFPDATWISSDFSFSPDGTTLAFWGCKDNRERCAVFLEDTQSKDVSVLVTLKNGASYFKWSPDGNYLSFIVNNPSSPTTPEFTVVNVPGGEIVSQDSIRNKNLLDGANPMNPYQGVSPDMAGAGLGQCIQVQD